MDKTVVELPGMALTVSVVLPETLPEVAVMVDVPALTPAPSPLPETVAMEVLPEDQLADDVIFFVVPSEYIPVAAN